jgi:hypothetical protein
MWTNAWYDRQPGRYQLHNGIVYAISPEGAGHAEVKFAVQAALAVGIRARGSHAAGRNDGAR